MLKSLFQSRKFVAMLAGVVIYAGSRFGFDVDQGDADRIIGLFALYIGAQGAADFGKEAAKVSKATGS